MFHESVLPPEHMIDDTESTLEGEPLIVRGSSN